jgi:uncharacterized damage-inducible protein DinB
MSMIQLFLKELDLEAQTTRKMLDLVPTEKLDWKPHQKSMTVRGLATHIAEIPTWIDLTLNKDELDFATSPYKPQPINNHDELMDFFERCLAEGKAYLEKANDGILSKTWNMRNGEEIYYTASKGEVIRMCYCQIVHHRAQLGVYLRLLDIPIPGSYGPSADEQHF